jgi:hypothetical protein
MKFRLDDEAPVTPVESNRKHFNQQRYRARGNTIPRH